jgi:hypothetical protein
MYGGTRRLPKFRTSAYSLPTAPTVPARPTLVFALAPHLHVLSVATALAPPPLATATWSHLRVHPSPPLSAALARLLPSPLVPTPSPPLGLCRVTPPLPAAATARHHRRPPCCDTFGPTPCPSWPIGADANANPEPASPATDSYRRAFALSRPLSATL